MIEEAEQRADGIEDICPAAEVVADHFIEPYALVAVDGRDTYSRFSRANVGGLKAPRKGWNRLSQTSSCPRGFPGALFADFEVPRRRGNPLDKRVSAPLRGAIQPYW